jgi:hypothetical protein
MAMNSQSPATLVIDADGHGAWDLVISTEHVSCATLEDARRLAHRRAADRRPCEVIVRDAYHRVIDRELIESQPHQPSTSGVGA